MNAKAKDMTEGNPVKLIVLFAIPLLFGNLFQQLYNTVDSLIVGNFAGNEALAAVSSSGSLIFLMVGFFNGVAMGAGVIISKYYGARDYDKMKTAIHTDLAFGLTAGVFLTVAGVLLTPQILKWMGTPKEVLPNSIIYFRIYFCGAIASVMYNICLGILQALGDSRHPLYYLIISSLINVCLDLIFVGGMGMGVGGAAFATVISQVVSAVLCLYKLTHTTEIYRVKLKAIGFDTTMLKQIINIGLPSGLQNSVISIANIVVQANINQFGKDAMAGCGSYSKIEGFGFLPITCFAMALTTYVGQNLGAKKYDRVKQGARFGMICSPLMAEAVGLMVFLFAPYLIRIFGGNSQAVMFGIAQCQTEGPFFFLLAFSHCIAGIMRGAGKTKVPMFTMLACWCLIRITYITLMVRMIPRIEVIFWAYPLTWFLSSVVFLIYYKKADWMHHFEHMEEAAAR